MQRLKMSVLAFEYVVMVRYVLGDGIAQVDILYMNVNLFELPLTNNQASNNKQIDLSAINDQVFLQRVEQFDHRLHVILDQQLQIYIGDAYLILLLFVYISFWIVKFQNRSFQVSIAGSVSNQIEFFLSYLYLILGDHHMHGYRKEVELDLNPNTSQQTPRHSEDEEIILKQNSINPHIAFEKNYPKNIFIPLIQHLNQRGLKESYEACVGTRQSFQGKNVVSLAEIHKLLSQPWFTSSINLTALVSNMSNKILLNSKIKKKLFHLLLVRQLFKIPLEDAKEFKKQVSKKANQVSQQKLIDDSLFNYPSALIYLLRLFAGCLQSGKQTQKITEIHQNQLLFASQLKRGYLLEQNSHNNLNLEKEQQTSSKEEYKLYISKIISNLNSFRGDVVQILDLLQQTKQIIGQRQAEIRSKYKLPVYVPQWSYFSSIVIYNCQLVKRNKQKVTYSMLNQWIQEFRQASTTLQGFKTLVKPEEPVTHSFTPIILVSPPAV